MPLKPPTSAQPVRSNPLLYVSLTLGIAGSGAVVLSWVLNWPLLRTFYPAMGIIVFNTALCFLLICLALAIQSRHPYSTSRNGYSAGQALALLATLIAALTVAQHVFDVDLLVDEILIEDTANHGVIEHPNRMALSTSIAFVILGIATIFMDTRLFGRELPFQYAVAILAFTAFVNFVARLFTISASSLTSYTQMSFQTASLFLVVCVAYLSARPHQGLMAEFNSGYIGAAMARRMIPVAVFAPVLSFYLLWWGQKQGFYTSSAGMAILLVGLTAGSSFLIWWNARGLNKADMIQRQLQGLFTVAFESAPYGMLIVDKNGGIVQANPVAAGMFGYSQRELLSMNVDRLVPGRARHDHAALRTSYMKEQTTRPMGADRQVFGCRKDKTEFPAEIGLSPVETGDSSYVFAVIVDVTSRKKTQDELARYTQELERSNNELEQFAYVASHDLQEPLRMVGSYVQLLERRYADKLDSDAREFIAFAIEGANRMHQLINDLLSLSRVGRRGREILPTPSEQALKSAVANLQAAVRNAEATVTSDSLPEVMADETQLVQLFQNLIANALKFRGKDSPHVHVSAVRNGTSWIFSVRDNGIGIEKEYNQRIFLIFQRLHTREQYPGTGIGLAICKRIVDRHGGKIWVESEPGLGSTFYFTLTAVQNEDMAHVTK